jgi:heptaprenyl diphosphate synthase
MAEAHEVTEQWASEARASLEPLPDSPAKAALETLCAFVANRSV